MSLTMLWVIGRNSFAFDSLDSSLYTSFLPPPSFPGCCSHRCPPPTAPPHLSHKRICIYTDLCRARFSTLYAFSRTEHEHFVYDRTGMCVLIFTIVV